MAVVISGQKVALREEGQVFIYPTSTTVDLPALKSKVFFHFSFSLALETEPIKGKGCRDVFRVSQQSESC